MKPAIIIVVVVGFLALNSSPSFAASFTYSYTPSDLSTLSIPSSVDLSTVQTFITLVTPFAPAGSSLPLSSVSGGTVSSDAVQTPIDATAIPNAPVVDPSALQQTGTNAIAIIFNYAGASTGALAAVSSFSPNYALAAPQVATSTST